MASRTTIPVDTVDGLFKALSVLCRTVTHILQDRAVEEGLGTPVSYSKVQLLRLLSHRGGQTSSQIARFLGIRRPSVSQLTDAMERLGWITRRAGEQDGRESIHELTAEGRQQFSAVRRQQRHLLRNALRLEDRNEAAAWTAVVQKISSALAQADRGFKQYCLQCGAHSDGTCVLVGGDADCPFLHRRESQRPGIASKNAASAPRGGRRRPKKTDRMG